MNLLSEEGRRKFALAPQVMVLLEENQILRGLPLLRIIRRVLLQKENLKTPTCFTTVNLVAARVLTLVNLLRIPKKVITVIARKILNRTPITVAPNTVPKTTTIPIKILLITIMMVHLNSDRPNLFPPVIQTT